jgi:hypothetical protein
MKKCTTISILLLCLLFFKLNAQFDCSNNLDIAQSNFDKGILENFPNLLLPCIDNNYKIDENRKAYKLIILSYIFSNNIKEAELVMKRFLTKYPDYETNPNDQAEFTQLFNKFDNKPFISVRLFGGFNYSDAVILKEYGTYSFLKSKSGSYNPLSGYQLGLALTKKVISTIDLIAEFRLATSNYKYVWDDTLKNINLVYTESQLHIEMPFGISYNHKITKKINGYLKGEYCLNYLLSNDVVPQKSYKYVSGQNLTVTGDSYSIKDRRRIITNSVNLGIGIEYKIGKNILFFDFTSNMGIQNSIDTYKRYSNIPEIKEYYYVDNDYKINIFQFSLGFVYNFYKPRINVKL